MNCGSLTEARPLRASGWRGRARTVPYGSGPWRRGPARGAGRPGRAGRPPRRAAERESSRLVSTVQVNTLAPKQKGGADSRPSSASSNVAPFLPVFVHWVPGVTYLSANAYDPRIPKLVVKECRPRGAAAGGGGPGQCANVRIGRLTDPAHPAYGQHGLFAAKKLAAGTHVVDYRGVVTLLEHESKTSDYTLAFVEEGVRLTLDADTAGNEGRFINDFRGCGEGLRANVKFASRRDERGELQTGVYALRDIAKHAELLLSYGKGYWLARGLLRGGDEEPAAAEDEEAAPLASVLASLGISS